MRGIIHQFGGLRSPHSEKQSLDTPWLNPYYCYSTVFSTPLALSPSFSAKVKKIHDFSSSFIGFFESKEPLREINVSQTRGITRSRKPHNVSAAPRGT